MSQALDVRNPRNGKVDYQIQALEGPEIQSICQSMREKQSDWQKKGIEHRVGAMQAWKKSVEKYLPEIIEALILDTGRKSESLLEADLLAKSIDRWCGIATDFFSEKIVKTSSVPFIDIHQALVPYRLVGVISPWNFPLLLSIIDSIPALLAGCAVVVKPSEVTPRFIKAMAKSISEVPALSGVFAYIEGAGATGAELIKTVDLVCFTGSVATGRKVYDAASANFIPAFLELGGKDAALVFDSADLDQASSSLLWGSVVNAGHSCLSIERVYVQEGVYEAFVDKIVAKAKKLRFAYPQLDDGQIGPIISDRQVSIIDEHLKDAREKGATFHTGKGHCEKLGGGDWCFPTILTDVNHDMKIMTEETFGPIIPIMPFTDRQDGVDKANSTIFGLSGAVFAGTWEEAMEIGSEMEAGAISINDAALTAIIHEGEKNSFKFSGIGGTRMGPGAIKRFMRQKAFLVKKQAIPSPWWF